MILSRMLCAFALTLASGVARAEESPMDTVFAQLEQANLMAAFFQQASMEDVPSGRYILEGLQVLDADAAVPFRHVAGDGAGGAFILLQDGSLAWVDSEGSAAALGRTLDEALATVLALGSWVDALRFTRAPTKAGARAAWDEWRAKWNVPDGPESAEASREIATLLALPEITDPFGALYDAARQGAALTFQAPVGEFVNRGRPDP